MRWQYGLKEYTVEDTIIYELTEIYGDGESHLSDSLTISGESTEDIILDLEIILNDLKKNLKIVKVKKLTQLT